MATLRDLIDADLVPFVVPLTWHRPTQDVTYHALLWPTGDIRHAGQTYKTPSGAAGVAVNGWTAWRLPDGRTLDEVRLELEARP